MRSRVEEAAAAWRDARLKACAAPMGNLQIWTDLGAAETALSDAVKAMLNREAEKAGRPYTHVVHGFRYGLPMIEPACSLDDAIRTAWDVVEENDWRPVEIRTNAGELVMDQAQLRAAMKELA